MAILLGRFNRGIVLGHATRTAAIVSSSEDAILGEFDPLDNFYGIWGTKLLVSSFVGPLIRLQRISDSVQGDFCSFNSTGWLDSDEIITWLGGSAGGIVTMYDQTGNLRNASNLIVANMPRINVSLGAHPCIEFTAASSQYLTISQASTFGQNSGAVSQVSVVKLKDTSSNYGIFSFQSTVGARCSSYNVGALHIANGRRLDADSTQNTAGLAATTAWTTRVTRWEWSGAKLHSSADSVNETKDPFQTAGSTSNTASTVSLIGASPGALFMNGYGTCFAAFSDLLTTAERDSLIASLAFVKL